MTLELISQLKDECKLSDLALPNSLPKTGQIRLLIVQYAGDYRETVQRFQDGGRETYHAQKYSVEAVAEIGKRIAEVSVICCLTEEPYNEVLSNGVRAIGAGFNKDIDLPKLLELIKEQNPTHLVVRTPIREIFQWAIKNKVRTIATLADSFSPKGLRNKLRNYRLASLLNNEQIDWVGNHGTTSCLSLQKIGVNPNKIIPWDWPYQTTPNSFSAKQLEENQKTWNLFYAGSLTEAKGVGDIIEAVAKLRAKDLPVNLKIAGRGETEYFINKAKELNIEDCVEFLGTVPNSTIVSRMRKADLVIVPSRHECPEGFPLVIYEAFCSRTPLVASDHPMFGNSLNHRVNAMIFPAGNAAALSECIEQLLSDSELYSSLSVASKEAWNRLQVPVKWAEMIDRWLDDSLENQQWLLQHRFSSGRYALNQPSRTWQSKILPAFG